MSADELKNQEAMIEKLVVLSKRGNQDAFAKLYDIFVDPIYRYVYYRVNAGDAEDIVETVFLKVWENIRQYKQQKRSFSAWIFRIAHNLIVDHYRSAKDRIFEELHPQIPDQSRQHNPIKSAQTILDNEVLKKALNNMKHQYREVIIYKFINELSNKEISEILGKSEGSLRILQFRALKALKKVLEEMGVNY
ncbi:MAG: sigma-70 family RNA polymerase sigma factor [Patescibacteria group bacterium]